MSNFNQMQSIKSYKNCNHNPFLHSISDPETIDLLVIIADYPIETMGALYKGQWKKQNQLLFSKDLAWSVTSAFIMILNYYLEWIMSY